MGRNTADLKAAILEKSAPSRGDSLIAESSSPSLPLLKTQRPHAVRAELLRAQVKGKFRVSFNNSVVSRDFFGKPSCERACDV